MVGGDTPSAVARTVSLIEGLGFSVQTCDGVLDVLGHVNGRQRAELVVLELGRDAWIYFALIEVLAREHHPVPLLVLTDRSEWLNRIRALDIPVLIRPFDRSKLEAAVQALLADGAALQAGA